MFWVADGHGGRECVDYLAENLQPLVLENLRLIDSVKNLCEGVKILIEKTFYQLDFGFYQKYKEAALVSGATLLMVLIIGCRVFVINLGDCVGTLGKVNKLVKLN
jgi:serine/threonine protein phosphatase PrpC